MSAKFHKILNIYASCNNNEVTITTSIVVYEMVRRGFLVDLHKLNVYEGKTHKNVNKQQTPLKETG